MEQHPPSGRSRTHGILFPQRLPEFHRLSPPDDLAHAVGWFWIPEWTLAPGERSVQQILPYPVCNLVIDASGVTTVGPPTRASERVLTGRGWAVGALLRPAAARLLIADLAALRDAARTLDDAELHRAVVAAMSDPDATGDERRATAVAHVAEWIRARAPVPAPGTEGALANELQLALADPSVTRVADLAARLHASTRTLQRIAARSFGLSLHSMIRRRRLQEAADRLRRDPDLTIALLAGELGYADHAHFTSDFRRLLGVTPSAYRARASAPYSEPRATSR